MSIDLFDIEDCDDSGATEHKIEPMPPLTIRPFSEWLADLARVFLDEPTPAPATAAR